MCGGGGGGGGVRGAGGVGGNMGYIKRGTKGAVETFGMEWRD